MQQLARSGSSEGGRVGVDVRVLDIARSKGVGDESGCTPCGADGDGDPGIDPALSPPTRTVGGRGGGLLLGPADGEGGAGTTSRTAAVIALSAAVRLWPTAAPALATYLAGVLCGAGGGAVGAALALLPPGWSPSSLQSTSGASITPRVSHRSHTPPCWKSAGQKLAARQPRCMTPQC